MSELRVLPGGPEGTEPEPQAGLVPAAQRIRVVVHRMDGGLENGESEARALSAAGFPIFTQADPDRPRLIPLTDIKYVVLGSVEDPNLEDDPRDVRRSCVSATGSGSPLTWTRARSTTASGSR